MLQQVATDAAPCELDGLKGGIQIMAWGRIGAQALLLLSSSVVAVACGDGVPTGNSSAEGDSPNVDQGAGSAGAGGAEASTGVGSSSSGGTSGEGAVPNSGGSGGSDEATGGTTSTGGGSSADLGTLTLELDGNFIDFEVTQSNSIENSYVIEGTATNSETIASIHITFMSMGPNTYVCSTGGSAYIYLVPTGSQSLDDLLVSVRGDSCSIEMTEFGMAGERLVGTFSGEVVAENASTGTITNGTIDVFRAIHN